MLCQEIDQERQLNRIDDTSGKTNPYKTLIVNNAEKIEPLLTQNGAVDYHEQLTQLYTV